MLPERQRELVATSLIGVEQLTETVHEFLDLTRIEAGELRLNLEPVHVSAVIARSTAAGRGAGEGAGHLARALDVDTDLPPILADPLRLRAVFDNILSNALKYTPERRAHQRRESSRSRRTERDAARGVSDQHRRHGPRHSAPRSGRESSTSSFGSNTIRPRDAQEREAPALVCTCAGRSSSCTAARSRAAPASMNAGPASRSRCRHTWPRQWPPRTPSSSRAGGERFHHAYQGLRKGI